MKAKWFQYFTAANFALRVMILILLPQQLLAQEITIDDLMPPVSGGPREIKQPERVTVRDNIVTASSAQDAVNAAVDYHQQTGDDKMRTSFILFGSGMGVVATGEAVYAHAEDPITTQISQREAYVVAYNRAKKNLAGLLAGYDHKADSKMNSALARFAASQGQASNTVRDNSENVQQSLSALLKGYVVYDVTEDPENHSVSVTIAATPKTLGKVTRQSNTQIVAEDLRYGLEQVLNEVKNDLVPPVGGRVITIEKTGETAVIGFGSCIIPAHDDVSVQADQRRQALTTSAEYASDVLCGLLLGDEVAWNGGSTVTTSQKFGATDDPSDVEALKPAARKELKQLEDQRLHFTRKFRRTDAWRSARHGQLPPGVIIRTWQDGDWAYAMCVYVPSFTNMAAGLATQMKEGSLLKPVNPAAFRSPSDADEPKPRPSFRPRPSGRVSPDRF